MAAKASVENKLGYKEVAKGINSPEPFIAKILQELTRKNLLESIKGPSGGYFLNGEQLECSIGKIVFTMDGNKIFQRCILGLESCNEKMPCPLHTEYACIKADLIHLLETKRIKDFKSDLELGKYFLKK